MAQDNKAAANKEKNALGKKSVTKKILVGSLIIVTIAGASVGTTLFLTGYPPESSHGAANPITHPAAESAHTPEVNNSPAQYVPLDPPFIVNFEDQGVLRYLQLGVTVMTREKTGPEAVTNNLPPIRNNLIMLFAAQKYSDLGSTAGKEKLRTQALEEIQAILRKEIGRPGIEAVYFTNFVMQ